MMKEIFNVFFKLGLTAFGGPAAHIAMMEEEVVTKRKWMDRQHFLDFMGITNLIPGPNSTEMTMHCGYERGGVSGLFVAGISFIFPSALITLIFAWIYANYGTLPEVAPLLMGIKPAVLAIIAGAIMKLGKKALKSVELAVLGTLTILGVYLGLNEIAALLLTGLLGVAYFSLINLRVKSVSPLLFMGSAITGSSVFWTFLKIGAVLYGSGYVLFAYLDAEVVAKGWLSRQQLVDAIAVGQFTPGPVLTTATFIGYQLYGFTGALLATIGIFLPSFLFVWLLNPLIPRMRKSVPLGYFLDSVNVAAVAVMLVVLFAIGREALDGWKPVLIAAISLFFTFGPKKLSSMWIVIGGAGAGYLLSLV
jgi:chromate transporter